MRNTISGCRSCQGPDLIPILDLGSVPLANALLKEADLAQGEAEFPLHLVFCPRCTLLQIRETVDPETLFHDYPYFSSCSDTMLSHARDLAESIMKKFNIGPDSLVVEIASNDGYLLRNFVEREIPSLGIEPAANVARVATENGIPTVCEFFGPALATRLKREGRQADLILANNVLAHVADTNGFAAGVATLLKPRGCAVIEFPYARDMIEQTEFDTIYHEHLCYFSLNAVRNLFTRHGLCLTDVEHVPIHGGSLRIFLQPESTRTGSSRTVEMMIAEERERGMTGAVYYETFSRRVDRLREQLLAELGRRKEAKQSIAAYGASAKGSTLLNYCGIGPETLDFIVDCSPVKQGRFAPGNHLPILAPEALRKRRPDAVLLLAWNLADEIFRQQTAYLEGGGEWIVPIPEVRVIRREVEA